MSDHTYGSSSVLGSIPLGARVFEKHFTDDNSRVGPDHKFAMNPKTWRSMVRDANEVYISLGDGVKKIEDNELESSIIQRRALRFTSDFNLNHTLREGDLFPLRPQNRDGILPYEIENLIGKKLNKNVYKDDYIKWEDIK